MYFFVVFVIAAHLRMVTACPEGCSCDAGAKLVSCASRSLQLGRIPSNVPSETLYLTVNSQNISRIHREDFMRVPGLVSLDLSYNIIRVIDEDTFLDLMNLTELRLHSNSISVIGGPIFDHLQRLESLHLYSNPELVLTPCALTGLVSLRELSLTNTNVTYWPGLYSGGAGCEGAPPPPLEHLYISGTNTMVVDVETLGHHPGITSLSIGVKGLELTWQALEMLQRLMRLRIFYPSSDILLNNIPSSLENLTELYLGYVKAFPPSFPGHGHLQRLDMYYSSFTHLPPHAFVNVPSLEVLRIAGGALVHIDRDALGGLVNLTLLDLRDNNIQSLPAGLLSDVPSSFSFTDSCFVSNPLLCDCNIEWLVGYISNRGIGDGQGTCSSPAGLSGTRLNELTDDDFTHCSYTTPEPTTTTPAVPSTKPAVHGPTTAGALTSAPTREIVPPGSPTKGGSFPTSVSTLYDDSTLVTTPYDDTSNTNSTRDEHHRPATSGGGPMHSPSDSMSSRVTREGLDTREPLNVLIVVYCVLVVAIIMVVFGLVTVTICRRRRERKRSTAPDDNGNMINMTVNTSTQSNELT